MHTIRPTKISYSHIVYMLGGFVVALVMLYAYFVVGTIVEIVLREELELSIKDKYSTVASLEAAYLKAEEGVTLDHAIQLGFQPIIKEQYLSKQALSVKKSILRN